jgi:pimeloyl-ACP methyl ester carboxylesterase
VVLPSLPGYDFSDRPTERGMTRERVARLWGRLMTEVLGHERFAAHGGDVGGDVTQLLALDRPDSLVSIHPTDVPYSNLAAFAGDASDLSAAERDYVERGRRFVREEGAYAAIQSTKPQTLAYGLVTARRRWRRKSRGPAACDAYVFAGPREAAARPPSGPPSPP